MRIFQCIVKKNSSPNSIIIIIIVNTIMIVIIIIVTIIVVFIITIVTIIMAVLMIIVIVIILIIIVIVSYDITSSAVSLTVHGSCGARGLEGALHDSTRFARGTYSKPTRFAREEPYPTPLTVSGGGGGGWVRQTDRHTNRHELQFKYRVFF